MRRADREVKDKAEVIKIIEKCDVCRIALSDDNVPYVVPMNFGYDYDSGELVLYFHGASEGKKHDIIKKNPRACFEMDCSHRLIEAERAEDYTMEFESVIGDGKIYRITDKDEKIKALKHLMKNYAKDKEFVYPDHVVDSVTMLKLVVSEFTGKRLKRG